MFDFQGLGTKQVQLADIKLTANQIKLSVDALEFLGHNNNENNIFIDKDRRTGKFWIATIPTSEDSPAPGKKLTKSDGFGSQGLHHAMGGQYSEWKIEKLENETFEEVTYFQLTQTVDGTKKRAELEELSGLEEENVKTEAIEEDSSDAVAEDRSDDGVEEETDVESPFEEEEKDSTDF